MANLLHQNRLSFIILISLSLCTNCLTTDTGSTFFTSFQDGSYKITVGNEVWIQNASTFIRCEGQTYTTADGSLTMVGKAQKGTLRDKLGTASTTTYTYKAGYTGSLQTSIRQYRGTGVTIFTQNFLSDFKGTAQTSMNAVVSGFPGFKIVGPTMRDIGILEYAGLFIRERNVLKKWKKGLPLVDGLEYGPLLLFDELNNVVIISTFSKFMAASMEYNKNESTVTYGIMGKVDNIPKGYSMDTIVFCSSQGINMAMAEWGKIMRMWYDKNISPALDDFTVKYLGYYTDNGAYYYHHTEPEMNYEDTVLGSYSYAKDMGIPYRYIQYDDWFYYIAGKGYGATVTWDAMPKIFPHGLRWLYNTTGLPVIAHNRYWSNMTTYAKQNGGKFNFHMDKDMSLPLDQEFWDYLFGTAVQWGMLVYEQDWMNHQTEKIDILYSDLYAGSTWLNQMGEAASRWNLKLQYCMALPRHVLQSLEIRPVTQVRASIDYLLREFQWKIGISSILAHAMGLAPFKDNFWTTSDQPGNIYKKVEKYPELEVVVAVLSTGPVGVGDRIGYTNVATVSSTHTMDGLLLKPSKPATAIDWQIIQAALRKAPIGEVWSTYSDVSGFQFGVILATNFSQPLAITPQMAGFTNCVNNSCWIVKRKRLLPFNTATNIPLPFKSSAYMGNCTLKDFCLLYTSPSFMLRGQHILLFGEASKIVPMSAQRMTSLSVGDSDIKLTVKGSVGEFVFVSVVVDGRWMVIQCTIAESGESTISMAGMKCY